LGGDALKNFDLAPVRTRGTTEREVVNQPVAAAQQALALKQVEVTEVKSVSEAGRRETLKTLADYPLQLKAGDKVQLYQENGVVKYYTRVPAADANAVDGQAVQKLDEDVQSLKTRVQQAETLRAEVESLKGSGSALEQRLSTDAEALRAQTDEVAALKVELSALRKSTAAKDAEIVKLQTDLVQVRQSQDQLIARLPLDRLSRLEQQLGLLAPGAGGTSGRSRCRHAEGRGGRGRGQDGHQDAPGEEGPSPARRRADASPGHHEKTRTVPHEQIDN
jgi:hypothetical protein